MVGHGKQCGAGWWRGVALLLLWAGTACPAVDLDDQPMKK